MDIEDRYTRITLRLPKELHAKLSAAADETSKSTNAEIVARLEESFEAKATSEGRATVLELKSMMTESSLLAALTALVQQQPKSDERDTLLKQLIERFDAMGDIQQRLNELVQALPRKQPDAPPEPEAPQPLTVKRTRRTRRS